MSWRELLMKSYTLTAYAESGEKRLDEVFTAKNDTEAKTLGKQLLLESGNLYLTHRCVSSDGKLLLFHR